MTRKERCHTCGGSGRQVCMTCGGRGGRYRVTIDGYDYDGHPVDRERWESCYACGRQGTRLCSRCGGTGEIRSYDDTGGDAKPKEASASYLPRSPRDLRAEFDLTKRHVLALLLECDPLGDFEMRREIRDELRAVAIDTPDAYEKLNALLRSAEARGHNDAKYELGRRLLHGIGIKRNDVEGKRLLNDGAEHGHSGAARELRGPLPPRR
jgi:TPR repeat protein